MRGQWLGSYTGNHAGRIMVNIDEVDDHFEGIAYLKPSTNNIPASVAYFGTQNKIEEQTVTAYVNPVHPHTGIQCEWESIKSLYEGVEHSPQVSINLKVEGNRLHVNTITGVGIPYAAVLEKPLENGKSKIQGQQMSWDDFKSRISSLSESGFLFRGQQKPWSLCTSFHRRGRFRMSEFISKDVKLLYQRLSAVTSHFFDLAVPEQNGAFFNLLQHHGYPTPLLDWSYSPYVAAFFAFRDRPIDYSGDEVVRIYIFKNKEWQNRYQQIFNLDPPFPHLSVSEFIAIGNPRLVPQQAVTTATNLYDIESYVIEKETETGERFLDAIDIPANEREVAMRDLRFMGITAGSMFPSIDGICEELRERNFDR